jgi:hypothetical protein
MQITLLHLLVDVELMSTEKTLVLDQDTDGGLEEGFKRLSCCN